MNNFFQENPVNFEQNILLECYEKVGKYAEMTKSDKMFLSGIVRMIKPKRLIEIGVSSGGSSAIILNAIKDIPGAGLVSVEYLHHAYKYPDKPAGFVVKDLFPQLMNNWKLLTGGLLAHFKNDVPSDCDFLFLDTAHSLPGECLDFLLAFPYLSKNAVVVIHDINLHFLRLASSKNIKGTFASCLLFNCLLGEKITSPCCEYSVPTIGAIKLTNFSEQSIDSIFNLLSMPWTYIPSMDDIEEISSFIGEKYSPQKKDLFMLYFEAQKQMKR